MTSLTDWRYRPLIAELISEGLAVESGWLHGPLLRTPEPTWIPGAWFDSEAVKKVCRFFKLLRQQTGRWAGADFVLFDWQVEFIVAPIFGWKYLNGLRITRTAWIPMPRKNGKSTLCSGLALLLAFADGEPGAQVVAAAKNRDQAKFVFKPAAQMAEGAKALSKRLVILKDVIENKKTGSTFRAVSKDGDAQHGGNIHGAIIDEVHIHRSPDLIEAIESGTGSRLQPLVIFITTADAGDNEIYGQRHEHMQACASGVLQDAAFYGVLFGADKDSPGFDPFSEKTLEQANPGIGHTVTREYLIQAAKDAKEQPGKFNSFCRLHLNIRTKQATKFVSMPHWFYGSLMRNDEVFKNQIVYGGLDLSATTDLTAFVLIAGNASDGIDVDPMFWFPEERADELEMKHNIPFNKWAKDGWLILTEGNVVDYTRVRNDIRSRVNSLGCKVSEIGFDPWNATETVQRLQEDKFTTVPVRQGYGTLSGATKELERLILGSTAKKPLIRHCGHPVLSFCADCVEVRSDDNGNIRPVKPDRRISSARIDGWVAMTNAMSRLMVHQEQPARRAAGSR